jgi:hypothetical protein
MVFHSIYIVIMYILTNNAVFCFVGFEGVQHWQRLMSVSEILILGSYKTVTLSFHSRIF